MQQINQVERDLNRNYIVLKSGMPYSIEASIEATSTLLSAQLADKRSEIINILIDCASKLPEKLSVYTTLVGLLNIKSSTFVEEVRLLFVFVSSTF